MSGGGDSGSTNKTNKVDPWGPSTSFLKEGMTEAQRLYGLGQSQYTPWSQVASYNPNQIQYMQGVSDYVNSAGTQNLMSNGGSLVSGLLKGGNNIQGAIGNQSAGNLAGYMQNNSNIDPSGALNRFMYQTTNDPSLYNNVNAAVNQASDSFENLPSTMIQDKFGIGQKKMNELGDANTASTINKMMSNAYNMQDANRLQAIGLANNNASSKAGMIADLINSGDQYNLNAQRLGLQNIEQVLQNPLTMLQALGQMGDADQKMNQSMLSDATNRWNFDQNAAYNNLVRYRNLINPDPAWGTTNQVSSSTNSDATKNKATSAAGGAVAGAGTGATIGGPWGALIGGILGAAAGAFS